jgi:catechol 2,3-dioxygenase-like lactoylglutathione lyase family enzyme
VPTALKVAGYSHVAIAVTDLAAARAFYCGIFGFEELRRPDFGFPGMWLQVGDLQLHFIETDEMPTPGKGFPHFALYIPTETYHDTLKALAEAGATVPEPQSRDDWGTTVFQTFLTDPAGNVIELTNI